MTTFVRLHGFDRCGILVPCLFSSHPCHVLFLEGACHDQDLEIQVEAHPFVGKVLCEEAHQTVASPQVPKDHHRPFCLFVDPFFRRGKDPCDHGRGPLEEVVGHEIYRPFLEEDDRDDRTSHRPFPFPFGPHQNFFGRRDGVYRRGVDLCGGDLCLERTCFCHYDHPCFGSLDIGRVHDELFLDSCLCIHRRFALDLSGVHPTCCVLRVLHPDLLGPCHACQETE
mmetsp:Transcript_19144/g.29089  ORF Transcript_19144/g.29089 Transcript_19144/m.29089 type:complete len:225 (-) Transcript_19144:1250-1924(-)